MQIQTSSTISQYSEPRGLKPLIVACIPAYNEEKTIGAVLDQAFRYVDQVIVCDDGSSDRTAQIAEDKGATVVKNPVNLGKGRALHSGFQFTCRMAPDIVVMMDADGQHSPDDIPRLVEPIVRGEADLVVGSRYLRGSLTDAPLYRRIGLGIVNAFIRSANNTVRDTQSGFRAFNREALKIFSDMSERGFGVETEQLSTARNFGLRVKEVPVTIHYRGL
jgi:glycosyltransferase involved in cell wall biosynthesis